MQVWTDADTARVADRYQFRATDVLLTIERPGIKRFRLEDATMTHEELRKAQDAIRDDWAGGWDEESLKEHAKFQRADDPEYPVEPPELHFNNPSLGIRPVAPEPSPAYNQDIDGDTFVKFDHGKPRCELLPAEPLIAVAEILTSGAVKYEANQWTKGGPWMRCIGACLRHVFAWMAGEDNCPDSGHNHIAHAMCNLMFLLTFIIRNDGTDDRDPRNKAPQSPVSDDL